MATAEELSFRILRDANLDTVASLSRLRVPAVSDLALTTPIAGSIVYNTTNGTLYYADGAQWYPIEVAGGGGIDKWHYIADGPTETLCPDPAAPSAASPSNFVAPLPAQSTEGAGTRVMLTTNGAFRAGTVTADQWDLANRGDASVAMGIDCMASGDQSFASGQGCIASGPQSNAVGGTGNVASGLAASVGGGQSNVASGLQSVVSGGESNMGIGEQSTVSGGMSNSATGDLAMVGGGQSNAAFGDHSAIIGGMGNIASGLTSTISGGQSNVATGDQSVIAGGISNTSPGNQSVIGGGSTNTSTGIRSVISGGQSNSTIGAGSVISGGVGNVADGDYSVVSAGKFNATGSAYDVIAGGFSNTTSADYSVISGGYTNKTTGGYSVVGGGELNAAGDHSVVAGGKSNTVASAFSVVSGGASNTIDQTSIYSTIAGGLSNSITASDYCFAAGKQAAITHDGCFVWSDPTAPTVTTAVNQVVIGTSGGAVIYSDAARSIGVSLAPGGNAWAAVSDRNLKENFEGVDHARVLSALEELPVYRYNFRGVDPQTYCYGPTAQDWAAAFPSTKDPLRIDTMDLHGISLLAIKALIERVKDQEKVIEALRSKIGS